MAGLKKEEPITHFGRKLRNKAGGHLLTRDNYCTINNKSSFKSGLIYTEEWCQRHFEKCMINFDRNMTYFSSLDRDMFAKNVTNFISKNNKFNEIFDLSVCDGALCCYVMVLERYCQVYVGVSGDIAKRMSIHWSRTKEFDRLIFGNVNTSKLSIDSFRALDTTRIFISENSGTYDIEDKIIGQFDPQFVSNRISGGIVDGGLAEVCFNKDLAKPRSL